MIAFANANTYFNKINTCLIGLSIDSNPSHLAWMYDIYCKTGIVIPFPIIADRSGEIARKYGMISSSISNTSTVRNVFIIDDKQIVRTILVYPMNIGRNIPEILRIVKALQVSDENNQMAPANWMPCDPMIGSDGVHELLNLPLIEEEQEKFNHSCDVLVSMKDEIDNIIQ